MAARNLVLSRSMNLKHLLAIAVAVCVLVPRAVCTRDRLVPLVIWHGMGEANKNHITVFTMNVQIIYVSC